VRTLIILILIFLPVRALANIWIGVYPIKVKGSPYPFLSQVVTQQVLNELGFLSGADVRLLSSNETVPGYVIKGNILYDSGIFKVELNCYLGSRSIISLKKRVKGSELFITVERFCKKIQKRFSIEKTSFFSRLLKKLNPLRIILPQRGFELNVPVPLPIPPNELLQPKEG